MNYVQITFERTTLNAVLDVLIDAGCNPLDAPQDGCVVTSVPNALKEPAIKELIWALNDGALCEVEDLDYDEIEDLL